MEYAMTALTNTTMHTTILTARRSVGRIPSKSKMIPHVTIKADQRVNRYGQVRGSSTNRPRIVMPNEPICQIVMPRIVIPRIVMGLMGLMQNSNSHIMGEPYGPYAE